MVGLTLTGGKELAADLNALGGELKQAVLLDALMHAAEPMRAQMAAMAPRGDEAPHIADNIVISPIRKVDGVTLHEDEAAVAVGPAKRFFYGYFYEFGVGNVGERGARPFVRPGYDSTVSQALASLTTEIGAALMRAAGD